MSSLYPVREVSEEDVHFSTNDADVLDLLRDTSGETVVSDIGEATLGTSKSLCAAIVVLHSPWELHIKMV